MSKRAVLLFLLINGIIYANENQEKKESKLFEELRTTIETIRSSDTPPFPVEWLVIPALSKIFGTPSKTLKKTIVKIPRSKL